MMEECRFDEAILYFQKAITCLNETLQTATHPKVIESLVYQRKDYQKIIELAQIRKIECEKYQRAIEAYRLRQHKIAMDQNICPKPNETLTDIEISIYKALSQQDNLLASLKKKIEGSNDDSGAGAANLSAGSSNDSAKSNENTIYENITNINEDLHILVHNIVVKVDETKNEIEKLRERVKMLEKQRKTSHVGKKSSSDSPPIKADESPTSSEKENRRDSSIEEEHDVLPASSDLPPLELPDFDYNF